MARFAGMRTQWTVYGEERGRYSQNCLSGIETWQSPAMETQGRIIRQQKTFFSTFLSTPSVEQIPLLSFKRRVPIRTIPSITPFPPPALLMASLAF